MGEGSATGAAGRLTFFAICVVIALLFSAIFRGIDPHVDEAMLIANLRAMEISDVFKAMPLYEQVSPVGHTFLASAVTAAVSPHDIVALRLLSAFALMISALLIWWVLAKRKQAGIAPVAILLTCLAPMSFLYGVTIKHYVFEILAMSSALAGAVVAIDGPARTGRALGLLGLLLPSILVAMTGPLIIAAAGGGVILHIYLAADRGTRIKTVLPTALAAGAAFGGATIWHLTVNSELLTYQFSAYSAVYDNPGITLSPLDLAPLKRFVAQALRVLQPFGNGVPQLVHVGFATLIAVGLVSGFRHLRFVAISFMLLMAGLGALSALGLSPRLLDRHLLFVLPLSSILAAQGLFTLLSLGLNFISEKKNWRPTSATLSTVLILVAMAPASVTAWMRVERQQFSPLLAHLEQHPSDTAKVLMSFAAQPVVDALRPSGDPGYLGRVDAASSEAGWAAPYTVTERLDNGGRVRKPSATYLDHVADAVTGIDQVWILHTHLRSGMRWHILTEQVENTVGPCREKLRMRETLLLLCEAGSDR